MTRQTAFTPDLLAEISLALREVREINDYCLHATRVFEEHFSLEAGFAWCYHFYDGHLNFPRPPKGFPLEAYKDVLYELPIFQTDAWINTGQLYSHSAIYADQFPNASAQLEKMMTFFEGFAELQLGTWATEGRFLLGTAGLARPLKSVDFSETEFLNFKMLVPYWREGMAESARYSRGKLLGDEFAAIVENHPNALFLFDGDDRLKYANYQAKILIQNEPRPGSQVAVAEISTILKTLVAQRRTGHAVLPLGKSASILQLPDWPELGLRNPWISVVQEQPTALSLSLSLSEREVEVLRAYAQADGADAGAKKLGTAVATYRTHLKNIANKLGVSGSNAALTMWYLSGHLRP